MALWVVSARILKEEQSQGITWRSSVEVPTFLLDGDQLGIISEDHAERIARKVVDPTGSLDVVVTANRLEGVGLTLRS